MAKLSEVISKAALPSIGLFLVAFGLGGKQLPSVDALLTSWESWLGSHTSYPSLVVAGVVIVLAWVAYQLTELLVVRRKREWRRQLIELLKEGVAIRNDGAYSIRTKQAATRWMQRASDWRIRVFGEIKRLDENAAEDYELLDIVQPPRICISTPMTNHAHEFQQHDYRVLKLRGLIKDTQT